MKLLDQIQLEPTIDIRLDKLKMGSVPFDRLMISEKQKQRFDIEHVKDILENFHPALLRPVHVIEYNGNYIVWDGQHSAAVAYLSGMTGCPSMVYTCDTEDEYNEIMSTDTIETLDMAQIFDMILSDSVLLEKLQNSTT